jgi:hypothetical protein
MSTLRSLTSNIEDLLSNEYISTGIILFLVLYGGIAAPKLPRSIAKLFSHPLFNLIIIFSIAYIYKKNKSIALIATIVFVMSLQTLNKLETSEVIAKEIVVAAKHPAEEIRHLVGEEMKKLVAEEMKRPVEERRPAEEIRQVAEERVENNIMEESRRPMEEIRPSEEQRVFSEVPQSEEQIRVSSKDKKLVGEEIRRLIAEEIKRPIEERRPAEEIKQVAEERVERKIIEESRKPIEEVRPNEEQNNNIPLSRGIQELAEKSVTPISRVLVEEELKKMPIKEEQIRRIPVPIENNSLANIKEDQSSPLQNQINDTITAQPTDIRTRSSRGLNINEKCNLCNNKAKTNNSIEINAYGGNTFAEF